jgi:hypothetical protein
MEKPKRRPGRPTKPPTLGERVMLGLRVTPAMKLKLEAAAIESGRSISQECELRLEQSFSLPDAKEFATEIWRLLDMWRRDPRDLGNLEIDIDPTVLKRKRRAR